MKVLESLTIRSRLIFGYGFILALMVLLTVLGAQKVSFIDNTLSVITDENSMKQRYAINFRGSVHDRAIAVRDLFLAQHPTEIVEISREIAKLEQFYQESASALQDMQNSHISFNLPETKALAEIEQARARALPLIEQMIAAKRHNEVDAALTSVLLNQVRPAFTQWLAKINGFIDMQESANQALTPQAREVAGGFSNLMYILTSIAVVISIVVAIAIEKSLRNSIGGEPKDAERVVRSIAQGNLRTKTYTGLKNSILGQISMMQNRLTETVSQIVSASDDLADQTQTVSDNSAKILSTAQSQGELTVATFKKLDEIKSSISEITQIAKATEVNSLKTVESSGEGRNSIRETSNKMEKIAKTVLDSTQQIQTLEVKTNQIGEIISVIKSISEQTNLLALNAAIEAARAGASGRGFAVVADEVRQLSLRTNDATRQIEAMIAQLQTETSASVKLMEATVPEVNAGLGLIHNAMNLLVAIETQASDSLERVKEVSLAANTQVETVAEAVEKMQLIAQMSDQAIASIGDNNSAVFSLHTLSSQLKTEVSYFKV